MENDGGNQLVPSVTSATSSHGTVEFTGVRPQREQPVPASTSLSLVRPHIQQDEKSQATLLPFRLFGGFGRRGLQHWLSLNLSVSQHHALNLTHHFVQLHHPHLSHQTVIQQCTAPVHHTPITAGKLKLSVRK